MARTLEQFVTETTNAYKPSQDAIQNQINALSGQLAETEANINKQFAVQQQNLDDQRQTAASNASMQAAGSGGSFGGKANIANRNYYRDAYIPAVTQLQTNQSQALSEARQRSENQRLSLQSMLASLMTQANTSALSRYDNWDQFDQQLAWDKDKFNQNLAWDKDKFAQQLAESAKNRAASAASTANYWPTQTTPANTASYYNTTSTAKKDPSQAQTVRELTEILGYCPKDITKYGFNQDGTKRK